jgi:YD repeat-containing protein
MLRKTYILGSLGILLLVCIGFAIGLMLSYGRIPDRSPTQFNASMPKLGSDRDNDGFTGPVNRVMIESAKLSTKAGKLVEGPRELCELATYDRQGKKVNNSYYLVSVNAQAGREEYVYDDRGNISEMTVRDDGNNILSKEVYTYEYDAIGNWTKRVAYVVIYAGGKVRQQPTEATYRNITYYYDQTVANIAKANPSSTDAPADEQRAQGDLESLRTALDGWIAATNARDADKLISFYNSKVDAFYRSEHVSQEFVQADKAGWFKRADLLEVKATNPEITMSGDGRTATMRFHKTYTVKVGGREHHGEVLEWLKWLRTDDGWKIVGERDIRVLRKD